MSDVEAIVFDFDGVLVESVNVKGEAFVELYKSEKIEIQNEVLQYHQENGGMTRHDKISYYESTLCGRLVNDKQINTLADRFGKIVEQRVIDCAWVEGAKLFLEHFHRNIPLYVASATPQEELRRIIEARDMTSYFQATYGAPIKKDAHLRNIIKQCGYDVGRVLMVGDAMADYDAAKNVGTRFIGRRLADKGDIFPYGTTLIDDLTALSEHL